jgi:hypothetical protein
MNESCVEGIQKGRMAHGMEVGVLEGGRVVWEFGGSKGFLGI